MKREELFLYIFSNVNCFKLQQNWILLKVKIVFLLL